MAELDSWLVEKLNRIEQLAMKLKTLLDKLMDVSGYKVEELIEKFEAGWKLVPPEEKVEK